jgi:hypothetical protein
MNSIENLSVQQLRRIINLKDKIAALENKLSKLVGSTTEPFAARAPKKRRKMSAAGKARIVAAQKARWAKVKGKKSTGKPAKKARRKMSAAWRAKIAEAAKARWKKAKAQGKNSL